MAAEHRLDVVVLTVDGQPLAVEVLDRLTMLRVEESVHLPDAFTLRFDDPHFSVFDSETFTLGTQIEVALRAEGDAMTVTVGEVTAISIEQGGGGRHELVLQGMDAAHRLARGPKTRSFQQVTDADLAAQIAADHGLDADVEPTANVYGYVLQTSQTDYSFLKNRADRIGFDTWITDQTLHFRPRPCAASPAPTLVWGQNLHKWKARFSSTESCDEVRVRGWDPQGKQHFEGRATRRDSGTTAAAAEQLHADARRAFGEVTRFAGQFPVDSLDEADALAASLLLRASGGEVVARGETAGDPLLAAGAEVRVEGVGIRLSGTYQLTSVEHVYGPGRPYVSRFVCGGKDPASVADLLPAGAVGLRGTGWGGLVVGVVTNNDDPHRLGRVRVTFPTLSQHDESAWARLLAPGAGHQRGLQCLPEIGDEVLVGFELDDTHRPVVLGGLWNRDDPPPQAAALEGGQVTHRSWVSRDGQRLEFRDGAQPGATLEASEVEILAARKLTLRAPQIEIAADGDVTVSG
ncbi:MAG: VgrG-related protein, partial [Actinomycetota bacterium]|nr:VgrG-related protein [Actinomycetota bacterium]